jgi:hypothetical protein
MEQLWLEGRNPSEIHRLLGEDPQFERRPTLRTIQRFVQERTPPPDAPWTLTEADPGDVEPIMNVLAAVLLHSRGRKAAFSKQEAAAVLRVHRAASAPDLPIEQQLEPYFVYLAAALLVSRQHRGLPTVDIEAFLACRPWRSSKNRKSYEWLVEGGQIPAVPDWLEGKGLVGRIPTAEQVEELDR